MKPLGNGPRGFGSSGVSHTPCAPPSPASGLLGGPESHAIATAISEAKKSARMEAECIPRRGDYVQPGQPTGHVGPSTQVGGAGGPALLTKQQTWHESHAGSQLGGRQLP